MTKILHTGDLHLNALRRFRNLYLERMEFTLGKINKEAEKHDVDFIVVAGDFFERRDILHEERLLLSRWISGSPVPLIGISGNHDKRTDEMGDTVLSYLSGLEFEKTHVIHDSFPKVALYKNCVFVLFPYNKWTDHEFYLLLDATIPQAKKLAMGDPIVVVMHEAVSGGRFDNGMTVSNEDHIHLDEKLLSDFSDVTYWALGDMHSVQSIAPNVWYAGAPHQTKFGETEGKGVLIVDTEHPTEPEFVEIGSMPLVDVVEAPKDNRFDDTALYRFIPNHAIPASLHLPDNVVVDSKIVHESTDRNSPELLVDIFHGLDSALLRAGLKRDLIPMGIELATKAAAKLGIRTEATAPKTSKYKEEKDAE